MTEEDIQSQSSNRPVVLIVDDEEDILKLMYRQLAQLPYEIIPTTSPSEAIHLLQTREVSVLLCDLNMPHTDGNAILLAARAANPDLVSVAISGGADYEATIRAVNEGGIWKYIAKPWPHDALLELVKTAVDRYGRIRRPQSKLRGLAQSIADGDETPAKEFLHVMKKPRRVLDSSAGENDGSSDAEIEDGMLLGGRYELGGIIGEGGLGTVYRAFDTMLNMPVAVKILNARVSNNQLAISTLKEEARIAMQLSHKHIVRLHNLQKAGPRYYLVMEYVQGRTIFEILDAHGRLGLETVLQIIYVASDAISYAHRRGVLHKDLKPDNILLTEDGILKIIDFGIACLANTQDTGAIMGTPVYMSPEQIRGEMLDQRTDVYSAGIIVYEMLTGRSPFPEEVDLDTVINHMPLNVFAPEIPREVAQVIDTAVSPDREDRWPTMYAFTTSLIDAAQKSQDAAPASPLPD